MKTVLTILASLTLFTSIASADHGCATPRRVVGYTHCGDPIVATYEYVGRSRCGEPIYQWVTHYPRERERVIVREEPRITLPLPSFSLYLGGRSYSDHRDYGRGYGHDYRCR